MSINQTANRGAVVITGASTGIGEACALYLDRLGFQIFVGVRKTADGEVLKRKGSDRLTPVLIDVTDTASIQSAAENVTKAVGERGLVGLVNNAGIAVVGPLEFLPIDDLRQQLEVNVVGQIAVTQAFLPLLRKGFGRIVNVGSMSGKIATPFIGAYAASKFALEALTDSLRMELQPWGISVSIIEPGKVATPIWKKTKVTTEERMKRLPQEGYDFYGPVMVSIIKNTDKMGKAGIPADTVAEVITRALTARRPKTRYLVGRDAKLATLIFRRLPDRMRDWLIAQGLKRREEVS